MINLVCVVYVVQDSDSFNQPYQYAGEVPEVSVLPRSKPSRAQRRGAPEPEALVGGWL